MRRSQALVALATFSTLVSAWPWPPLAWESNQGMSPARLPVLVERQQNNNNNDASSSNGATTSQDAKTAVITSPPSASGSQTDDNNKNTSGATSTTIKSGNSNTKTTITATPSINPEDPAGSISMLVPPVSSGTQYYLSGVPVTFIWEYTDLVVPPTAVDVIATVATTAGAAPYSTYTIAANQSFEKTQTVIWDTASSAGGNALYLPVAMYTMVVYDASSNITAVPRPGYLSPAQYPFGVYTHSPVATAYPSSQMVCVTCNAAGGRMEFLALSVFTIIVGGTMASFLLFL